MPFDKHTSIVRYQMVHLERFLLSLALLGSTFMGYAQPGTADSLTKDTVATKARLGARIAIGALYTSVPTSVNSTNERFPMYGARAQVLVPIGSQLDITANAEFHYVPERSYTESQYIYSTTGSGYAVFTSAAPAAQLGSLHAGLRLYARTRKVGSLVSVLNPRLQRLFWRKRADRSGFHIGCGGGFVHGWHRRIIRTLPADWTANDPVPENAMTRREEPYTRWYWSVTPVEVGWTFKGRLDLTAGMRLMGLHSIPTQPELEVGLGNPEGVMLTGSLAWVFGRTGLKDLSNGSGASITKEQTAIVDSTRLELRLAVGGVFALTDQGGIAGMPNIRYGMRTELLVPVGAHTDISCAGEFLIIPAWTYGEVDHAPSQSAGFRLGMRYYTRTRSSIAYANATSKRDERAVWRQRVDRNGFHLDFNTGLMQSWYSSTYGVDTDSSTQMHWIFPSPGLGWTFNGRVDLAVSGGYVITPARTKLDNTRTGPWGNCCLAVVFGSSARE